MTFKPLAAEIASLSIFVAERIKTASTPEERQASNSDLFAPSQLIISNSGPRASRVAGLNSSAIRTLGLATRGRSFLVIILIGSFNPRHHLA